MSRHNFRIDVEDEGIRYWLLSKHVRPYDVLEEPPSNAPSDRIFHSEEERRASPLFQHICT